MNYDFYGRVVSLGTIESGQGARGEWKSQDVVFEHEVGQYPRHVVVRLWGDNLSRYQFVLNQFYHLVCRIDARESSGRWFNTISLVNAEAIDQQTCYNNQMGNRMGAPITQGYQQPSMGGYQQPSMGYGQQPVMGGYNQPMMGGMPQQTMNMPQQQMGGFTQPAMGGGMAQPMTPPPFGNVPQQPMTQQPVVSSAPSGDFVPPVGNVPTHDSLTQAPQLDAEGPADPLPF